MEKIQLPKCEIEKRQRVHDLEKTVLALNEWFEKELNGYMSSLVAQKENLHCLTLPLLELKMPQ